MIEAMCGDCGTKYSVDPSHAGKRGKCKYCGGVVSITSASAPRAPHSAETIAGASRDQADEAEAPFIAQIATADTLQGWTITDYRGLVSTNVVTGTGFLSDVAAGLTDIFGGRSETYSRQLGDIEGEALDALRRAARDRGANWIVGARIDFDEISGKGMQMFMVSAQGTAVRAIPASPPASRKTSTDVMPGAVAREAIRRQNLLRLLSRVENGQEAVTHDVLSTLCKAPLSQCVPLLLGVVLNESATDATRRMAMDGLRQAPRRAVREALHDTLLREPRYRAANELYRDLRLLDPGWVLQQIQSGDRQAQWVALRMLCSSVASSYIREDVETFRGLVTAIPSKFPETCSYHDAKSLFGGKVTQQWRCENGHDNAIAIERCPLCGVDCYGAPDWAGNAAEGLRIASATLAVLEKHFVT